MASYIAGPSVLRLDGRVDQPIQPDEPFEYAFSPEQEAILLACGAITKADAAPAPSVEPAGSTGAKE